MKYTDTIKGQYYKYLYVGYNYYVIGRCTESGTYIASGLKLTMDNEPREYFPNGTFSSSTSIEPLTNQQDIDWIDLCIENNKLMPKPEQYAIY